MGLDPAEEVPSSKGEMDVRKHIRRELWQGLRNDTAPVKDDPSDGDVPGDLVKRRLPIGASSYNGEDLPGTRG